MSKTKLAVLVFCIAFGVNIFAFVFSKKTFVVEEVKNVWLYELPPSASPLDAYVSLEIGPHQGVVGTLFMPNENPTGHALRTLLADQWKWDERSQELTVELKKGLTYSNREAILPEHFVRAHEFLIQQTGSFAYSAVWDAWLHSTYLATAGGLKIKLNQVSSEFDLEDFIAQVLTHPLSGVIHPQNLEALKKGDLLTKDWISSGPYKVRKWNPKEIEIVSRDDFPVMMQKEFFRTLKFQSAPVKNPSCDFMQGRPGDEKTLTEHAVLPTRNVVSIFWICRSYQEASVCQDPTNRAALGKLFSGEVQAQSQLLQGKTVRYRIPSGSDEFRTTIRSQLESTVKAAGGTPEEISYFFRSSKKADIELEFVLAPQTKYTSDFATSLARMSSRLGAGAKNETDLVGLIASYPANVLTKVKKGELYPKVFLEPDLDEKKLPL